jgi:hypothetical protein
METGSLQVVGEAKMILDGIVMILYLSFFLYTLSFLHS